VADAAGEAAGVGDAGAVTR